MTQRAGVLQVLPKPMIISLVFDAFRPSRQSTAMTLKIEKGTEELGALFNRPTAPWGECVLDIRTFDMAQLTKTLT